MPTNPPSLPSLDVEACVRLLTLLDTHPTHVAGGYLNEAERGLLRALASALPGMGKALDLVRDCPRCQGHLRSGRITLAQSERETHAAIAAARAAQPEETSADAE